MAKTKQSYDPHPGVAMMRQWIDTLKEKSGRDVDEWKSLVLKKGPAGTNERRQWLKDEHGLGTNSASWLVDYAEERDDLAESDPKKYSVRASEYVDKWLRKAYEMDA
jgi:hypothetical protein